MYQRTPVLFYVDTCDSMASTIFCGWIAIHKGNYSSCVLDREEEKGYHGVNLWFIQREI